jgi:hypothetical protein
VLDKTDDLTKWQALRPMFANATEPGKECRLPNSDDLNRFEIDTGAVLPAGYRGFTQVFGPGVLTVGKGWIRCLAPYSPDPAYDLRQSVLKFRQTWEKSSWLLSPQHFRLIVFASDSFGNGFGWDPEDVSDATAPEYGICCWIHGDDKHALKLTRTFEGFIRLFTNQTEFRTRTRAKASNPDITDPTFDYFKKEDGTEIPGTHGQPLIRQFKQLPRSGR